MTFLEKMHIFDENMKNESSRNGEKTAEVVAGHDTEGILPPQTVFYPYGYDTEGILARKNLCSIKFLDLRLNYQRYAIYVHPVNHEETIRYYIPRWGNYEELKAMKKDIDEGMNKEVPRSEAASMDRYRLFLDETVSEWQLDVLMRFDYDDDGDYIGKHQKLSGTLRWTEKADKDVKNMAKLYVARRIFTVGALDRYEDMKLFFKEDDSIKDPDFIRIGNTMEKVKMDMYMQWTGNESQLPILKDMIKKCKVGRYITFHFDRKYKKHEIFKSTPGKGPTCFCDGIFNYGECVELVKKTRRWDFIRETLKAQGIEYFFKP